MATPIDIIAGLVVVDVVYDCIKLAAGLLILVFLLRLLFKHSVRLVECISSSLCLKSTNCHTGDCSRSKITIVCHKYLDNKRKVVGVGFDNKIYLILLGGEREKLLDTIILGEKGNNAGVSTPPASVVQVENVCVDSCDCNQESMQQCAKKE